MSTWGTMAVINDDKVHVVTGGALAYDNGDPAVQKKIAKTLANMSADGDIKQNLIDTAVRYQKDFYDREPYVVDIDTTAGAIANTILAKADVWNKTFDENSVIGDFYSCFIDGKDEGNILVERNNNEHSGYRLQLGNFNSDKGYEHGTITLFYENKPSAEILKEDIKRVLSGQVQFRNLDNNTYDSGPHMIKYETREGDVPTDEQREQIAVRCRNDMLTGYNNMNAYKNLEYREYPYDPERGGWSPDVEGDAGQYAYIRNLNDNAVYSRDNRVFSLDKNDVAVMDWSCSHKFVKKALPLGNLSKEQEYNHKPTVDTRLMADNNFDFIGEFTFIDPDQAKEIQKHGVDIITWHGEKWNDDSQTPYVRTKDYEEYVEKQSGHVISNEDSIELKVGYHEYNLYVNDKEVATINDPGEIAADWQSKDDIRDFANDMGEYAGDKLNNLFNTWDDKYSVSESGKEAIADAVFKEMEYQYGHDLPEHRPQKSTISLTD